MDIEITTPEQTYPYFAIWNFDGTLPTKIDINDIVMVSLIKDPDDGLDEAVPKPYVQSLTGKSVGFFTKSEHEYARLPKGYTLTLTS